MGDGRSVALTPFVAVAVAVALGGGGHWSSLNDAFSTFRAVEFFLEFDSFSLTGLVG